MPHAQGERSCSSEGMKRAHFLNHWLDDFREGQSLPLSALVAASAACEVDF